MGIHQVGEGMEFFETEITKNPLCASSLVVLLSFTHRRPPIVTHNDYRGEKMVEGGRGGGRERPKEAGRRERERNVSNRHGINTGVVRAMTIAINTMLLGFSKCTLTVPREFCNLFNHQAWEMAHQHGLQNEVEDGT